MNLHYKSPHAFINTISFYDEEIHTPEYFKREKIITLNCICIMLYKVTLRKEVLLAALECTKIG